MGGGTYGGCLNEFSVRYEMSSLVFFLKNGTRKASRGTDASITWKIKE